MWAAVGGGPLGPLAELVTGQNQGSEDEDADGGPTLRLSRMRFIQSTKAASGVRQARSGLLRLGTGAFKADKKLIAPVACGGEAMVQEGESDVDASPLL